MRGAEYPSSGEPLFLLKHNAHFMCFMELGWNHDTLVPLGDEVCFFIFLVQAAFG